MSREKQVKHGIRFGWHTPSQKMVTAVDVDNGLACDCVCVACNARLVSKQGEFRIWHFAHYRDSDCPFATEAAIHWMAKQLIAEKGGIFVPSHVVSKLVHGRRNVWSETISVDAQSAGFHQIADCRIEKSIEGETAESSFRRPDLVAKLGNWRLAVEIHNTHAVDWGKAKWLERHGFSVLEIDVHDLAMLPTEEYKAALERRLFSASRFSRWHAHMGEPAAREQLEALEAALRLAKKAEEDVALARLGQLEAAQKRREKYRKQFVHIERFQLKFSGGVMCIGRNELGSTLRIMGSAPGLLFSKTIEMARKQGGTFNQRFGCWEFYGHSHAKAFYDLLCANVKAIAVAIVFEQNVRGDTLRKSAAQRQSHALVPRLLPPPRFADPGLQELFQERAAIFEYDGGLSRSMAEQRAFEYVTAFMASQTGIPS